MRYDERDDGELLELAQAGWSPAFAVLVHRHAPALLAAFSDDPDPLERVTDVMLRAMRQLPERDASAPVGPWLFALAGRAAPDPAVVPAVDEETLDPLWRHLAVRWPDGRHVHRPRQRPAARVVVTVIGAIALGIAVPTIVLGVPTAAPDDQVESVRAQPLDDEPDIGDAPVDLPTFEFPDVGSGQDQSGPGPAAPAEPAPTTDAPAPTAPVVPAPPPPSPTPTPTPDVTEEPAPVVTEEPTQEPTDGTDTGAEDGDGDGDGEAADLPLIGGGGRP